MANQNGIAIVIKAFLPTGKTIDEQFKALGLVKTAHETGDYTEVLKAAKIEEVKSEQKTRRVEGSAQADAGSSEPQTIATPGTAPTDKPNIAVDGKGRGKAA